MAKGNGKSGAGRIVPSATTSDWIRDGVTGAWENAKQTPGADLDPQTIAAQAGGATDATLHAQTILCLTYAGKPIEPPFGAPMRVKIPTKLGFKQPKFVTEIRVTNDFPAGYW